MSRPVLVEKRRRRKAFSTSRESLEEKVEGERGREEGEERRRVCLFG